jgi:hypothetical protein
MKEYAGKYLQRNKARNGSPKQIVFSNEAD